MLRKRLHAIRKPTMIEIVWTFPTVIAVLLIEASFHGGVFVPVPFLALLVSVTIAGAMGGQRVGIIAGFLAAAFVVHGYLDQFGPASLTGGMPQAAIGAMLYFLTGTLLGQLRDQRDASIQSLLENEQRLETKLQSESIEKARQVDKVAERETRLDAATQLAGIGHFSFEAFTGRCIFCSEQHAANMGMTVDEFQTTGSGPKPELDHIHPDDHSNVMDAIHCLNSGKSRNFEFRVQHSTGELKYIRQFEQPKFDQSGKVVEHFGLSIDLTELREAEARARQSQRIEAIGTLTGGVAHDFNNLLAVILGNLELCLDEDQDDMRRQYIQAAITATNRGAGLTRNLLSFARRAHLVPARLNLNQTIQNTMTWATRVLSETIIVETSLMAGLWDVELDATSAENALINLLLNARDAMPEGGKVTIETANMRISDEYVVERDEDIEPGRYVMLAISDTGHGIRAENVKKIFEPFYTDKPIGEGSGLGLSMVQGFIKQSGGAIRVYSEVGIGTTFKLYFKASGPKADEPLSEYIKPSITASEGKKILVAEDEEGVLTILEHVLASAGFEVTTAKCGDEALEVFKSSGPFDLLLTDIVMPGTLQGPALAKALRQIDQNLPCIFMSGYASEATVHGNGLKPSDIRLMKPTRRDDLLIAVTKALSHINHDD